MNIFQASRSREMLGIINECQSRREQTMIWNPASSKPDSIPEGARFFIDDISVIPFNIFMKKNDFIFLGKESNRGQNIPQELLDRTADINRFSNIMKVDFGFDSFTYIHSMFSRFEDLVNANCVAVGSKPPIEIFNYVGPITSFELISLAQNSNYYHSFDNFLVPELNYYGLGKKIEKNPLDGVDILTFGDILNECINRRT